MGRKVATSMQAYEELNLNLNTILIGWIIDEDENNTGIQPIYFIYL